MSTAAEIWVDIMDGEIEARFRYDPDLVDQVKEIPGRAWDPEKRCWHWPLSRITLEELRDIGARLSVEAEDFLVDRSPNQLPVTAKETFTVLLGMFDQPLRGAVYRALARVLHPDVGGDLESMRALNQAKDAIEVRPVF